MLIEGVCCLEDILLLNLETSGLRLFFEPKPRQSAFIPLYPLHCRYRGHVRCYYERYTV